MNRLSELSERGHANNFNLIRLLAAWAVIFSHSFPLSGRAEPHVGSMSIGRAAVDVFFITSGFLVTRSLLRSQDLRSFILARAFRIYPGMIAMTLVVVLTAAACSPPDFLLDPRTYDYALRTAFPTVLKQPIDQLPGLFAHNPVPLAVNGSLWTLPSELRMYTLLGLVWLGAAFSLQRLRVTGRVLVGIALAAAPVTMLRPEWLSPHYLFMFFGGAAYYVLRRHIRLDARVAWAGLVLILASILAPALFPWVYDVGLAYVLFAAAYLVSCWRPRFDYSYGVYIYAFPVQQTLAAAFPGIGSWAMFWTTTPVALLLAALSWHLVEGPAQDWRKRKSVARAALASEP